MLLGVPASITMVFTILVETINWIYIGQLGVASLTAGIGLGNMILNVCCVSIAIGMTIETLVSQAYGNGQFQMCGLYLNRARVMNVAFMLPMTVILLLSEEILVGIGQDAETAGNAETYVIWLLPGVFALLQQQAIIRFV